MSRAGATPGPARARARAHTDSDLACAADALSCVESGEQSVLDLISQAAFLGNDVSSSSTTSSNSSLSIYSDNDNESACLKLALSDGEDDLAYDYPVDPMKIAALSSAFSSHHISSNKSKLYDGYIDSNDQLESRQTGQFLLPLFTSSEELSPDPRFIIKHEDILQVLAENSDDFTDLKENASIDSVISGVGASVAMDASETTEKCTPLVKHVGQIARNIKQLVKNLTSNKDGLRTDVKAYQDVSPFKDQSNPDKIKTVDVNDRNIIGDSDNCIGNMETEKSDATDCKVVEEFANAIDVVDEQHVNEVVDEQNANEVVDDKQFVFVHSNETDSNFLNKKCCDNKFLADDGFCSVNKCHDGWKNVRHELLKYILTPSSQQVAESPENEPISHVSQVLYDCDSVNSYLRFNYEPDTGCPGACGNQMPCSAYGHDPDNAHGPPPVTNSNKHKKHQVFDDVFILNDIQAAWDELKLMMLWFYWAIEKELGDLSKLAIGFQVPCNCCYCLSHRTKIEVVKNDWMNPNPGDTTTNTTTDTDSNTTTTTNVTTTNNVNNCVCQKNIVAMKCKGRSKTKFKSDSLTKDLPKCPYCLKNVEKEANPHNPANKKIVELLRNKEQTYNQCCCQNCRSKLVPVEKLPPMFVCSKDSNVPSVYVDVLTGEEVHKFEIDKTISQFYNATKERWLKKNKIESDKAYGSSVCSRCRCSCTTFRFYDFNKIISRMTLIIENFARVSMPQLYHRMRGLYLALCARYNARLYILLGSRCEYTFLKELINIIRTLRDGGIWLMSIMGPTRFRLGNVLYIMLPRKVFLQLSYLDWSGTAALHIFLKLSVMLSHNTLPAKWKDVLLHYVNILPYIHEVEVFNEKNIESNDLRIDPDEHLDKMYNFYSNIKKEYNYKKGLYLTVFAGNNEFRRKCQLPLFHEDFALYYYNNMADEIDLMRPEIELLKTYYYSGFDNFEKLIVFASFKVYATGEFVDNDYLKFQIEEVYDHFYSLIKNYKKKLESEIPSIYLLNSLKDHPSKLRLSSEVKRGFVSHLLKYNSRINLKKEGVKEFAKMFFFKHSKRCRNAWLNLMTVPIFTQYLNSLGAGGEVLDKTIEETHKSKKKTFCDDTFNPLLENLKSKPLNIIYIDCSPECDTKNFWLNCHKMERHQNLSTNDQFKNLVHVLDNGIIEDVAVPETFSYNESDDTVADGVVEADGTVAKNTCEKDVPGHDHTYSSSSKSALSNNQEQNVKTFDPSFLENIKISPAGIIEFIDRRLGLPPNYKRSLLKHFKHHCHAPKEINCMLDNFNENNIPEDFNKPPCFEKCCGDKVWNEVDWNDLDWNKNCADNHCNDQCDEDDDDDDTEYSNDEHFWDPLIEEIERELNKLEKKGKSREDFEKELHIACFKLVTRNMVHEAPADGQCNEKCENGEIRPRNDGEPRYIDQFCTKDYLRTNKAQFYEWRSIAMDLYFDVMRYSNPRDNKFKDGHRDKFPDEKVNFGEWYIIFSKLLKLTDGFVARPRRHLLGVTESYNTKEKNLGLVECQADSTILNFTLSGVSLIESQSKYLHGKNIPLFLPINIKYGRDMELVNRVRNFFPWKFLVHPASISDRFSRNVNQVLPPNKYNERPHIFAHIHMLNEVKGMVNSILEANKRRRLNHVHCNQNCPKSAPAPAPQQNVSQQNPKKCPSAVTEVKKTITITNIDKKTKIVPCDNNKNAKLKIDGAKSIRPIDSKDEEILNSIEKLIQSRSRSSAKTHVRHEINITAKATINNKDEVKVKFNSSHQRVDPHKVQKDAQPTSNPGEPKNQRQYANRAEEGCAGACSQEEKIEGQKCSRHPEMSRQNHQQSGDHPCNCCYCTVFGHAANCSRAPHTSVSRNFNETRKRLRTILNKKKMSNKPPTADNPNATGGTEVQDNNKNNQVQQNKPVGNKPPQQQCATQAKGSVQPTPAAKAPAQQGAAVKQPTQQNAPAKPSPQQGAAVKPNTQQGSIVKPQTPQGAPAKQPAQQVTKPQTQQNAAAKPQTQQAAAKPQTQQQGAAVKSTTQSAATKSAANAAAADKEHSKLNGPDERLNAENKRSVNNDSQKSTATADPKKVANSQQNNKKSDGKADSKNSKIREILLDHGDIDMRIWPGNRNLDLLKYLVPNSNGITAKTNEKLDAKNANNTEANQNSAQKCNTCHVGESKAMQTDNNLKKKILKPNETQSSNGPVKPTPKPQIDPRQLLPLSLHRESQTTSSATTVSMPTVNSRDSSFCTSSICSGCSEYKTREEDTRDVDMLLKYIEEPLATADKEKKQAKKARQKNKKLKMKLLKERVELHEDLISMVGETSRLREEVVRLEQGLASACLRLPPANKSKKNNGANEDMEEHECANLLRQAAAEASARATEAAALAEHAHSRLRHVESALNQLSSSVNKAYLSQNKVDQLDAEYQKVKKSESNSHLMSTLSSPERSNQFIENDGKKCNGLHKFVRQKSLYQDEPMVTITSKGSDHLIYHSHDPSRRSSSVNKNYQTAEVLEKQKPEKKAPVSWEASIAQMNALALTSKKPKDNSANEKKVEAAKSQKDKNKKASNAVIENKSNAKLAQKPSESNNKNQTGSENSKNNNKTNNQKVVENSNANKKTKGNKSETEIVNKNLDKNKKKGDYSPKPEKEVPIVNVNANNNGGKNKNKNTVVVDEYVPKPLTKSQKKNQNLNNNNSNKPQVIETVTFAKNGNNKNNKENKTVDKNLTAKATPPVKTPNNKGQKQNLNQNQNQGTQNKEKRNNQQQPQSQNTGAQMYSNKPKAQSSPQPNPSQQLHIVNSLSSTMDRIKLNDDTTIELASAQKKDILNDMNDLNGKGLNGAPVSSSIMEQLRSGVQFADLRLPPGITLTRVDPAKHPHVVSKPNIPLMTTNTPAAYRPTPPAPPPPAVIMVDTAKLHADRESGANANQADVKKPGKNKKSKKKFKKGQIYAQPLPGAAGSTTLKLPSHQSEDGPKMVTLRNPMFHSSMPSAGVPSMQQPNKRINDIRIPDPIPMPPNASCQATITPTSNGMYTIRNPLMSIVHQQNMMGMNSLDNSSPLLLMSNQHLNGSAPQSYMTEKQVPNNVEDKDANQNHSMADLTSRLSEISFERKIDVDHSAKETKPSDEYKYNFIQNCENQNVQQGHNVINIERIISPSPNKNVMNESGCNTTMNSLHSPPSERMCPKPIGTPFTLSQVNGDGSHLDMMTDPTEAEQPEPQKFYTPFGPTDADKSFGSMVYQPYVCSSPDNTDIWPNNLESDICQDDDPTLLPSIFHGMGTSSGLIDPNTSSAQRLDKPGQPITKMNNHEDLKSRQNMPAVNSLYYQQKSYVAPRDQPSYSKGWCTSLINQQDNHGYNNQPRAPQMNHNHIPSMPTALISAPNSVYMGSNSNSPPDSGKNVNSYVQSEYPYNQQAQSNTMKPGMHVYNTPMPIGSGDGNYAKYSNQPNPESFRRQKEYLEGRNAENSTTWNNIFSGDNLNNSFDDDSSYIDDIHSNANPAIHGAIGSHRLPNGLEKDMYFTGSGSIFAPDQSITNLNELDSSEREIESFKRFNFYFEPPKNKPKISLNVQDIALQRSCSSKSATTRDK